MEGSGAGCGCCKAVSLVAVPRRVGEDRGRLLQPRGEGMRRRGLGTERREVRDYIWLCRVPGRPWWREGGRADSGRCEWRTARHQSPGGGGGGSVVSVQSAGPSSLGTASPVKWPGPSVAARSWWHHGDGVGGAARSARRPSRKPGAWGLRGLPAGPAAETSPGNAKRACL